MPPSPPTRTRTVARRPRVSDYYSILAVSRCNFASPAGRRAASLSLEAEPTCRSAAGTRTTTNAGRFLA